MISSRVGLRAARAARQIRTSTQRQIGRRAQTTDASAATEASQQSGFAKLWNSPVGPKTVHFWAPIMKWSLVLAGAADFFRPPDKLSLTQNMALVATGSIWVRWCFVITPKNYFLATVNFFVACVAIIQTTRILRWQSSQKGSLEAAVVDDAKEAASAGKSAVKEGEEKVKAAIK